MIDALVERQLVRAEARFGERLDYLRDIYRASAAALVKFALFVPFARHRKSAPAEAHFVARLVAIRYEDCGPCAQIAIDDAKRNGVAREIILAALQHDGAGLPPRLDLVRRFAAAVVQNAPELEDLRLALTAELGAAAMTDLAIGIASARVFPTLKRALGHAQSCALWNFRV